MSWIHRLYRSWFTSKYQSSAHNEPNETIHDHRAFPIAQLTYADQTAINALQSQYHKAYSCFSTSRELKSSPAYPILSPHTIPPLRPFPLQISTPTRSLVPHEPSSRRPRKTHARLLIVHERCLIPYRRVELSSAYPLLIQRPRSFTCSTCPRQGATGGTWWAIWIELWKWKERGKRGEGDEGGIWVGRAGR